MQTHILGFPRIGKHRELKKALEGYWSGRISESELCDTAARLKRQNWKIQHDSGLSCVTVGDFSLYDHILDMTMALGLIPRRFQDIPIGLGQYFAMARGDQKRNIPALEMTKWFNTNYHYLVPEIVPEQKLHPSLTTLLGDIGEVSSLGYIPKPVLTGPITYLALSKDGADTSRWTILPELTDAYISFLNELTEQGCRWIQLDEPILCTDMSEDLRAQFLSTYRRIRHGAPCAHTLLTPYFGSLADNLDIALASECDGIHLDLCADPHQLSEVFPRLPAHMSLSLGIVNGRNIWKTSYAHTLPVLRTATSQIGRDRLLVGSSCSLLHVPVDLEQEKHLEPKIKSWMAFAVQKCAEIAMLGNTVDREWNTAALNENRLATESRFTDERIFNREVRERCRNVSPDMLKRSVPHARRAVLQQAVLDLPLFPTTTIGSYPQTPAIRAARQQYRNGLLPEEKYRGFLKDEIRRVIEQQEILGLDVLVHGEPERNDMVEYFGQQLDGFCFTESGWVQSYGSRCVKPPILYGDVIRRHPMTVSWLSYAQSLTRKPVKGMLTGPVTILCWSFVRDDLSREDVCRQLALALRDEVLDLEKAGLSILQIDEAAFREGMPLRKKEAEKYLQWAVDAFRLTVSGVRETTQVHTHMCYSEFNSILKWIAAMDADVISIEASRSDMDLLRAFVSFQYPGAVGPGVYDIHSPCVPGIGEILERLKQALRYIRPEKLWVNPDCGLKTRGWPETLLSLANMVQAARILREKYAAVRKTRV